MSTLELRSGALGADRLWRTRAADHRTWRQTRRALWCTGKCRRGPALDLSVD